MRPVVALLLAIVTVVPVAWATPEPPAQAADSAVLVRSGCNLCHAAAGLPVAARVEACSGCHVWVRAMSADPAARARAMEIFPRWERYEKNLHTYFVVPDLDAAAARLDPAWVGRYLDDPHDLRPSLPETMPRLHLEPAARAEILAWFTARAVPVPAAPAVSTVDADAGRVLFETRGCVACHTFGARSTTATFAAAPDLAFARERVPPEVAVAWIVDPRSVSPAATMPALGLSRAEAVAVRDWLYTADPAAPVAGAADVVRFVVAGSAAGPPPVEPTWTDVEERVFGRICVHCHMDPAQNDGRRGPGNAGGFGWPETGIELQTYEGVVAHRDAILAALDRRVDEARRDCLTPGHAPATVPVPTRPGMPLGLPPLAEDDIGLVHRWFAAGAPR